MEITTFTNFRNNMKAYFEKILALGQPLFISRKGGDMVVMSKSEYQSMQETFHLLRSPKNAERLRQAIAADKANKAESKELLQE